MTELQSLRGDVDLIVIDAGSGLTSWTRRFWLRSRLVVLVTTSAGSALLDSYAAIKRSAAGAIAADIRLLVNQCEDDSIAAAAHTRLSNACQRFLARTVPSLPSLPRNAVDGDDRSQPRVWETPDSPFGHAAMWLGRAVSDIVACPTTIEPAHGERFLGSCATACGALVGLDNALSTARSNTKDYVVEPAVLNQVSKL